jgi:amidase
MNLRRCCSARNRDEEAAMAASAAPFPIQETTIAALQAAYVSGRATAVSVCHAHLDRIAAF